MRHGTWTQMYATHTLTVQYNQSTLKYLISWYRPEQTTHAWSLGSTVLEHWGRDKMDAITQTTSSNENV